VRTPARSRDDADVIRARLRALLAEPPQRRGWVPQDGATEQGNRDADHDDADHDDDEWDDDGWDDGHDAGDRDAGGDVHARPGAAGLPSGLGRHRAPGRTARLDPGRPAAWALWVVAVLAAVLVVGWTWLDRPAVDHVPAVVTTPAVSPGGAPETSTAGPAGAPTTTVGGTVVVSVVGLVAAPGLVTLPAGSRVADALAAAGGLLPEADAASINAAAVLSDGQQIEVGLPGAAPAPGAAAPAGDPGAGGLVDLNSATVADLDGLPGIGPVLAQRIVDHRSAHGPFGSVDELDDVSGIGPAIFAELVARVRV
jgi:competence protein ComEA